MLDVQNTPSIGNVFGCIIGCRSSTLVCGIIRCKHSANRSIVVCPFCSWQNFRFQANGCSVGWSMIILCRSLYKNVIFKMLSLKSINNPTCVDYYCSRKLCKLLSCCRSPLVILSSSSIVSEFGHLLFSLNEESMIVPLLFILLAYLIAGRNFREPRCLRDPMLATCLREMRLSQMRTLKIG